MKSKLKFCLPFFFLGLIGCSPATGGVEGKVFVGKTLVTEGTVSFQTSNGTVVTAAITPDGSYKALNVPVGVCKVAVNNPPSGEVDPSQATEDDKRKMIERADEKAKAKAVAEASKTRLPTTDEKRGLVPSRYFDPGRSGLSHTVSKGMTQYDIVLAAD